MFKRTVVRKLTDFLLTVSSYWETNDYIAAGIVSGLYFTEKYVLGFNVPLHGYRVGDLVEISVESPYSFYGTKDISIWFGKPVFGTVVEAGTVGCFEEQNATANVNKKQPFTWNGIRINYVVVLTTDGYVRIYEGNNLLRVSKVK